MINIIAIYVRQSVDKIDSISIETQIDFCKCRLLQNESFRVFSDKGYSGGTTNRPEYQKMLELCKQGKIEKIITYKLDRISRSLLHFVLLLEELEKTHTELVSCTEHFSSKSEMGVMIMKLLIMFAEMERKNIRVRIRDNYYARGEKGFYLGGIAPFGYKKIPLTVMGKKTSGYEINPNEEKIITKIYNLYVFENNSLNAVCKWLNSEKISTRKGNDWSPSTLVRLVRNPFYVKADWKIFDFFTTENAHVTSPPTDFSGKFGCVCYGDKEKRTHSKFATFEGEYITVGNHHGIVDSHVWLSATQKSRMQKFSPTEKSCGKTFLCKIVKCGECGANYNVTSSKGYTYMYCRKRKNGGCLSTVTSIRCDFLENIVGEILKTQLWVLSKLERSTTISCDEIALRGEVSQLNARIEKIQSELSSCTDDEFPTVVLTLKELSSNLSQKKSDLEKAVEKNNKICYTNIKQLSENFHALSLEQKSIILQTLAEKIIIKDKKIQIFLKFNTGDV